MLTKHFLSANFFWDIANLKLDIYRVMKIHIRNYYGGARGPLLAPLLVVVYNHLKMFIIILTPFYAS